MYWSVVKTRLINNLFETTTQTRLSEHRQQIQPPNGELSILLLILDHLLKKMKGN